MCVVGLNAPCSQVCAGPIGTASSANRASDLLGRQVGNISVVLCSFVGALGVVAKRPLAPS